MSNEKAGRGQYKRLAAAAALVVACLAGGSAIIDSGQEWRSADNGTSGPKDTYVGSSVPNQTPAS
ncbi:hypothetical protein ACFQ05_35700 [Amycolatopsis umgeniensis]|uniref:Uncharacterized protein n=1 Tax=Amycolatopsis umgeniensis TaxID=336628 RepID=A0A841B8R1_9PSEU|nr:hypothetical protein [Amycolatopsis umgeniensis]MBB5855697.1 hypothetical protein [Amycolatopsis umgeniensis]